jgi:glycosyltransferase involved in cell wall biosynthesis
MNTGDEKSRRKIRIALVIDFPTRHLERGAWEKLHDHPDIDLTLLLVPRNKVSRRPLHEDWNYKLLSTFPPRFLGAFGFIPRICPMMALDLWKIRPDLVIIYGYTFTFSTYLLTIIASALMKKPFILCGEPNIADEKTGSRLKRFLRNLILTPCVKGSAAVLALGDASKAYWRHYGAEDKKVFLAVHAVENDFFSKGALKARASREEIKIALGLQGKTVILYVGQLIKRKGVEYLLRAFARLKQKRGNVALVIVGDGNLRDELPKLCIKENISDVLFAGRKTREELVKSYGIADVFCLPSLAEAWGLVINEAMAAGLPVVATRMVGATPDLVKDGLNGYVVADGDEVELFNALDKVVASEALREEMGRESRRIVADYTHEAAFEGYMDAIDYVCRKGNYIFGNDTGVEGHPPSP